MSELHNEIDAINTVHNILEPLDEEARGRVLRYVASLLKVDSMLDSGGSPASLDGGVSQDLEEGEKAEESTYASFADFYAAANPQSNGERALVAGYWSQVCQGADSFTGAAANKELTHLGHRVSNITDAINTMKNRKPALMLQIKKAGTSRQSRKLYKVSHEGEKRVEEMVNG